MIKIFNGSDYYEEGFQQQLKENMVEGVFGDDTLNEAREEIMFRDYTEFFNILEQIDFKHKLYVFCDLGFWNGRDKGFILGSDNQETIKILRQNMAKNDFSLENIKIDYLDDERMFKITLPHHDSVHFLYLAYLDSNQLNNGDCKKILKPFYKITHNQILKKLSN